VSASSSAEPGCWVATRPNVSVARQRFIRPEAPQHRKVGRLSIGARWLWVVMILQSDDEGRLVADPGQLRLAGFGYDLDVDDAKIASWLAEIAASGLVRLYEADGTAYAHFPSWKEYQHPKYPTPSRLPVPPAFPQASPSVPPALEKDCSMGVVGSGGEGSGVEGKGGVRGGKRALPSFSSSSKPSTEAQSSSKLSPFPDTYEAWERQQQSKASR
jgi:hypothetical protein